MWWGRHKGRSRSIYSQDSEGSQEVRLGYRPSRPHPLIHSPREALSPNSPATFPEHHHQQGTISLWHILNSNHNSSTSMVKIKIAIALHQRQRRYVKGALA